MRTLILHLLLICSIVVANARTISGTVLSSTDSTAIAGASCRLLLDKKAIAGAVADADGHFLLETDSKAAAVLEIGMTGYSATSVLITAGAASLNIGPVYLDEGIALNEVAVTAVGITESRGRMIVYPSAEEVKASATSMGLFQKLPLPGLDANPINRTLTVDGGSPVILINGVPSSIDDVNALQPKDIAKIEYSRFTPARYADKGNVGFINITLKQRTDGGQVYLWGHSAVNTAFMDANVRAAYHQGPSQFTLSYNPSWRNYQSAYDSTAESYIGDDFRVNLESHDRNPFYYHYHNVRLKYDYSPSVKTLFSATFSINPNLSKQRMIAHTFNSELGEYDNYNVSKNSSYNPSLDLFLRHDFNDRNSLEAQMVGTLTMSDYRRDNNYTFSDATTSAYIMNVDSRRRSLITEVNYIHNFNDRAQLSAGYQNTVSHSTNTYLSSDYRPVLTENNNYFYARFGYSIGKVYLTMSTGAKLYWIKNDVNNRHFIRNLSQAQASWTISQTWSLTGAFQYTPGIPYLSALTDYPQQVSPYLVSNGNPNLKVAENYLVQLMPSFKYKKFQASLLMNYRTVSNAVITDIDYLSNHLFLTHSVNARRTWSAWGNLNMRLNAIAGFGINANLGLSHYEAMGAGWCNTLTSFNASFSLWWNKGPLTVSYWRKIPGKYLNGHYQGKDENGDTLQFEYKPNGHWTLGAAWMYMFDRKGTRYPSQFLSTVNPSINDRYIRDNSNMVVLSASYSADFGSIFRAGRRNLNNADGASSLLQL